MVDDSDNHNVLRVPTSIFITLLLAVLGAVSTGAWYASAKMTAVDALTVRMASVEAHLEMASDARATEAQSVNDRLTRIEAQLYYLVGNKQGRQGRAQNEGTAP